MKYLFLAIVVLVALYVVSLQRQLDGKGYPFGIRLPGMLDSTRQSSGDPAVDRAYYVGYQANNRYREALLLIGSGVGLAGALGWISIRRAENRTNKIRRVEQDVHGNTH